MAGKEHEQQGARTHHGFFKRQRNRADRKRRLWSEMLCYVRKKKLPVSRAPPPTLSTTSTSPESSLQSSPKPPSTPWTPAAAIANTICTMATSKWVSQDLARTQDPPPPPKPWCTARPCKSFACLANCSCTACESLSCVKFAARLHLFSCWAVPHCEGMGHNKGLIWETSYLEWCVWKGIYCAKSMMGTQETKIGIIRAFVRSVVPNRIPNMPWRWCSINTIY